MLRVRKTYYSLHLAESFISEYCSIYVRQPRYLALTFLIPQQPESKLSIWGSREKSRQSSTQKETRMRGGAIMESSLAGLYYHYAFQDNLCPVTLAHQIFVFHSSLYFYTSDIFRPILALFTHLHQFFLMYITTRIFLLSLMTLLLGIKLLFLISAVKGLV